ncbi:MAG: hypothetical protein JXQ99_04150 [Hyphomicrobiaceae bacterium]
MALAAASIKVGHVFLIDGTPYDWGSSRDASDSALQAYEYAAKKIKYYRPELMVTELVTGKSKKGQYTRSLINQFMKAAQDNDVPWLLTTREQHHANKFQEAIKLVERFPEMKSTLPPKRYWWQTEDQRMIIFEATALAFTAIEETQRNNAEQEQA